MRNLYDIFCSTNRQCEMFLQPIAECIKNGDNDLALEYIVKLLRSELDEMQPVSFFNSVYRFTGFPQNAKGTSVYDNAIIKDIEYGRMTVSNPTNFNDPMDPLIRVWAGEMKKESRSRINRKMYGLIEDAMNYFRVGCFAEYGPTEENLPPSLRVPPYENTLMWGHYAKGHRGVCIQYRLSQSVLDRYTDDHHKLYFGNIAYRPHKIMSSMITFDNALLAKSASWMYENESRLIYFSDNQEEWRGPDGKIKDYISLEAFDIEAIYMGYRINDNYRNAILDIAKRKRIPVFQMEFEMCDLTKLRAREIPVNDIFWDGKV